VQTLARKTLEHRTVGDQHSELKGHGTTPRYCKRRAIYHFQRGVQRVSYAQNSVAKFLRLNALF
jgi:hypothetical protein